MSNCKHVSLRSWKFEVNGEPAGMWSCVDCGHKFVPLDLPQEKDAERYRKLCDVPGALDAFTAAYHNTQTKVQLDAAVDRVPAVGAA